MVSNLVDESTIEAYITVYGFGSPEAIYVAMEEEVEVLDSHILTADKADKVLY